MLCVKLAAVDGPPSMQLLLARLAIHTAAVLICCAFKLFGFHGRFWAFNSSRAAILCVSSGLINLLVIQLLYYATTKLSLSLATVLYFTSPVWSVVWKTLALGDPVSYMDAAFSLLAVVATIIVTLPHGHEESSENNADVAGTLAALSSGALQALAHTMVQALRRWEQHWGIPVAHRVHWLQINMANAVFGAVVCPLFLWGPFKTQEPVDLLTLTSHQHFEIFGLGGFTVIAQFCLVQSQGYLDACVVTVIRTLDVMYALFYQSAVFTHQLPTCTDTLGCVLLISACAGSAWYAHWLAKRIAQ